MLQLKNDEFKDDAINALVELGQPALPRLVKALKDKDENVRKQAVLALGKIKHAEAIDPLIDMLSDSDWFTRLTSAAALEAIGDDRGREAIKPLMKDPDLVVRMRVERILAKWKKQPAGREKVRQRCSRIAQRLNVPKRTPRLFARCGRAGRPF